eukprot:632077-Pleurochrysis_carterae.AAC.1
MAKIKLQSTQGRTTTREECHVWITHIPNTRNVASSHCGRAKRALLRSRTMARERTSEKLFPPTILLRGRRIGWDGSGMARSLVPDWE